MALANCPEFEVLVKWLDQSAESRSNEISEHVAICERCTSLVAAGAAEFHWRKTAQPVAELAAAAAAAPMKSAPARRRKRAVALWTAAASLVVVTGASFLWGTERGNSIVRSLAAFVSGGTAKDSTDPKTETNATKNTRDPSLGKPIAEWTRQELIEFVVSPRNHETNHLAEIFYRCRDERIHEAVPRALRTYRQSVTPVPGVVAKHVIAARAFVESLTPAEIETALKLHGNVWMTYEKYTRELSEKGGNR